MPEGHSTRGNGLRGDRKSTEGPPPLYGGGGFPGCGGFPEYGWSATGKVFSEKNIKIRICNLYL